MINGASDLIGKVMGEKGRHTRFAVGAPSLPLGVAVEIEALDTFWPAGAEHQDYAEKNPIRYQRYRFGCRRDQRLRDVWGEDALSGAP